MKAYTLEEYQLVDCLQVVDQIGVMLHEATQGKICDSGCAAFNGGRCPAFNKLIASPIQHKKIEYSETVREEAIRTGLGIKAVRRLRQAKRNET